MADPNQETPEALQARIAELESQLAAAKAVRAPPTGGQRNIGIGGDATGNIIFSGDRNIGSVEQLRIESAIFFTPPSPGQVDPRVLLWQYLNQVVTDTATLNLTGVDRKIATDKEEARLELAAVYTELDTLMPKYFGTIGVRLSQGRPLMAERERRQSVL